MRRALFTLALTLSIFATLDTQASPIMQGGRPVITSTCNPSTTCYVKRLLKTRNIAFIQAANGVMLGHVYASVPDGCWLAYSNGEILKRMKMQINYHQSLADASLYALGFAPFACQ